MDTTRLWTKGQILIPSGLRARDGWEPGTELRIEDRGGRRVLRAAKPSSPTRLEDGIGCIGDRGPARTRQ